MAANGFFYLYLRGISTEYETFPIYLVDEPYVNVELRTSSYKSLLVV